MMYNAAGERGNEGPFSNESLWPIYLGDKGHGHMSARCPKKVSYDKTVRPAKKRGRKAMGAVGRGKQPEGAPKGFQDEPEHVKKMRLQNVIEYLQVTPPGPTSPCPLQPPSLSRSAT